MDNHLLKHIRSLEMMCLFIMLSTLW